MNSYLRNQTEYEFKNVYLENLITSLVKLINESPKFDNNYKVYRFIKTDNHLQHLNVGDIYIDNGFISTTRNPYYKPETYNFGFILIIINIPKNIKGVSLSLETYSHFKEEEEILFAPFSNLKLIGKDKDIDFYHIDDKFNKKIQTKYEFQYINNTYMKNIEKIDRIILMEETKKIDFINLEKYDIDDFIKKYCNPMNQFIVELSGKEFTINVEKYDSSNAYKKYYALTKKNGYSFYTLYNNYLLFMIEIDENMHVNYYVKYSMIDRTKIINEFDFLKFIASIAYYFNSSIVFIHCDYIESIGGDGTFIYDFYDYLKSGKKKYIDYPEITNGFLYYNLDSLKNINIEMILNINDKDELYQLYKKIYEIDFEKQKRNIADFYVWICENHCNLHDILMEKISKLFTTINPFKNSYYIFRSNDFLYNNGIINVFPIKNYEKKIIYKFERNDEISETESVISR